MKTIKNVLGCDKLIIICTKYIKGALLDKDNLLWKNINGKMIGKPAVQLKSFEGKSTHRMIWFEDAKLEDIDDKYYNVDGSKK